MIERGWTIVFDEEVRNPGKSVRDQQRSENEPGLPERGSGEQERPGGDSSHRMKNAGERLAMRQDVRRPKFREAPRILHVVILPQAPGAVISKIEMQTSCSGGPETGHWR